MDDADPDRSTTPTRSASGPTWSAARSRSWKDLLEPRVQGQGVDPQHPVDRHHGRGDGRAKSAGNIKYADKGNMTKAEIDKTIDFLIEAKKAGQFRAFWKTFDESVNLMASGEVVIQSMWSPAVTAVRSQGHPLHLPAAQGRLSRLGRRASASPSTCSGAKLDAAYEYINWYLSGWVGAYPQPPGLLLGRARDRQGQHDAPTSGASGWKASPPQERHQGAGRQGDGEGRRGARRRLVRRAHGRASPAGTP